MLNDERLLNASRALLNADVATKTSSADPKTVLLMSGLGNAWSRSFFQFNDLTAIAFILLYG